MAGTDSRGGKRLDSQSHTEFELTSEQYDRFIASLPGRRLPGLPVADAMLYQDARGTYTRFTAMYSDNQTPRATFRYYQSATGVQTGVTAVVYDPEIARALEAAGARRMPPVPPITEDIRRLVESLSRRETVDQLRSIPRKDLDALANGLKSALDTIKGVQDESGRPRIRV